MIDFLIRLDTKVFLFFNKTLKCKLLDFIMPIFTHIAGFASTVGICLVLMMLVPSVSGKSVLGAVFFAQVTSHTIKFVSKRVRPHIKLPDVNIFNKLMHYDPSFPSAHTATIVSLATVIVIQMPYLFLPFAILCTCVGISRIYLGQHYPIDVIIGAIIGFISGALASLIF